MKSNWIILIICVLVYSYSFAGTYVVTSTGDNGPGTLRESILSANQHVGLDTINFDFKDNGPWIISVWSALPIITDAVYINGYSQKGIRPGKPQIVITCNYNVSDIITGLSLGAGSDHSTIRGCVFNNNTGYGISISNSNYSHIEENYFGTDISGRSAQGNEKGGIIITGGSSNIVIGGTNASKGNLISGNNKSGIKIENQSNNIVITGNLIGLNIDGSRILSNNDNGIFIDESENVIIEGANTISGNGKSGICVVSGSNHVVIRNNSIGTDPKGNIILGNGENGIFIERSGNGIIGGDLIHDKNIIAGNVKSGITLVAQSNLVKIKGNYIGLLADGLTDGGNLENGIFIENCNDIIIGGNKTNDRNIIASNKQSGIVLYNGADRNEIKGNYIGLAADGLTARGNVFNGIYNEKSKDNIIGGTLPVERNYICNNDFGIFITVGSTNCVISNNFIGWIAARHTLCPNFKDGIWIEKAANILIKSNKIQGFYNADIRARASEEVSVESNNVGFFYIIVFFIILVIGFISITIRKDTYYIIYIVTIVFVLLSLNDIIYNIYWPEWITNNKITSFIIGGLTICSLLYIQRTFKLQNNPEYNPKIFKILLIILIGFVLSIFINNYKLDIVLAVLVISSALAYIFKPIINALKKPYLPTFYYLLAWIILLAGTITQVVNNIGLIPHNIFSGYTLQFITSMLELILFSIGLGYQITILKNENEQARVQLEEYLKLINIQQKAQAEVSKKQPVKEQAILQNARPTQFVYQIKQEDVNDYFLSPLTERELEVLSLIAAGKSNKEIAEKLFLSVNTIKSHVLKIYEKLDVNNRMMAVSKAISLDIFKKD